MIAGTTTIGSHAPAVNFVIATIISTMNVATAPTPLTTRSRCQPGSCSVRWRTTMAAWLSVNEVNTPTA